MGAMPADLVTTSGSGLDPDLSPEPRWRRRPDRPRAWTGCRAGPRAGRRATEDSVLGDPHVNVLALNRALDALTKR